MLKISFNNVCKIQSILKKENKNGSVQAAIFILKQVHGIKISYTILNIKP